MGAVFGWGLAFAGVVAGWLLWGWRGVALAVSAVVFWLLLQFSQALRAMRDAGGRPVGQVPSAVMLHARMARGQRLMDLIRRTRSLGRKLADTPETYAWEDASGARLVVTLTGGRVDGWTLERPAEATAAPEASGAPPASP